jgi:uncharacterized repeat protein (TIGR03803 family)
MLGLSFLAYKSDPLFTKSAALRLAAAVLVLATAAWSQSTEKVLIKSLIGGNGSLFFDQQSDFYGTEDRLTKFGAVYRVHHYLNGTWGIKVLYHFTGGSDGAYPQSHPVLDNAGNLYGATWAGGSNICSAGSVPNCGAVFELTPTSSGSWTEKVLYDFTHSADGFDPSAGVILDNVGNLYGTTSFGGPHAGTIFELVPNSNGTWTHKVLYGFTGGADGGGPSGGLVRDSAGNLYGTTGYGGSTGRGTIFELSPGSNGAWTFHVLHSFCVRTNCSDGEPGSGFASVILDSHGNLYGMTSAGGQVSVSCPAGFIDGCGTAFKLTHTTTGAWTFQRLYAFCSLDGCIDGKGPEGLSARWSRTSVRHNASGWQPGLWHGLQAFARPWQSLDRRCAALILCASRLC